VAPGRRVEWVTPLLEDPEPSVRDAALSVVVRGASGAQAGELLSHLEGELDPETRGAALLEAAEVLVPASPERYRALALGLLADPSPAARTLGARALAEAGNAADRPALEQAFLGETDPYARAALLLSSDRLEGTALAGEARKELVSSPHWFLRAAAARYLGRPESARAAHRTVDTLAGVAGNREEDGRVREAAAASLGRLDAREPLRKLAGEGDAVARRAAVLAYPDEPREEALALARQLDSDPAEPVRWAALLARARLADRTAAPQLADGLRAANPVQRGEALVALRALTGQDLGLDHQAWVDWLARQNGR